MAVDRNQNHESPTAQPKLSRLANRTLKRSSALAWAAIAWERLWPLLLPALGITIIFLALSWFGAWPVLSNWVRWTIVGVLGLGLLGALSVLKAFRLPEPELVRKRVETRSELEHRPVTALSDKLTRPSSQSQSQSKGDPLTRALWNEHQLRMADKVRGLKSGLPTPDVARRDPYALRAAFLLVLFVAFGAGWGNWSSRIQAAFIDHSPQIADLGRVDAWVTPPAYTNRPPIFLSGTKRSEAETIFVPEGSELVVRVLKLTTPRVLMNADGTEVEVEAVQEEEDATASAQQIADKSAAPEPSDKQSETYKIVLGASSTVQLWSGTNAVDSWAFSVKPDEDPQIRFTEDPASSTRGALEFAFEVEDDYGVSSATADIAPVVSPQLPDGKAAEPLIDAPQITLPLPSRRARKGTSKTSQDLTAHPWAGTEVTMSLTAEDQAGQTGKSEAKTFILPQRIFTKPLALAIVDERRILALDVNQADRVAEMLDIITSTHPEEFIKDKAVYTALRVAYRTIRRTRDKDELREMLDLLWETALSIEDGDLSLAERRLRDAQERLAKALENGASDEEIAELMQELRNAMNEFMRELAEQMQRNQQNQQAMPLDPNTQVLRQQDLERMMQQIEDLAKSGSRDAARQLLEEMQRMMNNLQTARPQQQQQQRQTDEFSQQMNKLGEMMRQQQQLMDQTFEMQRRQQQQQRNGQQQQQGQQQQGQQQQGQQGQQGEQQQPMTPEEFAEAMRRLQEQQGDLQRQMQELQQAMRDLGMEPGESLGEAGEAMGGAEQSLGEGQTGEATGEQGRALQAMREGAQQMMQNMQNQAGEQGRQGERGQHGQQSRGERDPLGRQSRSQGPQLGNDTKVPGEIDAQRAREILDVIRRRLSNPQRPQLEIDYLDRLLPTR